MRALALLVAVLLVLPGGLPAAETADLETARRLLVEAEMALRGAQSGEARLAAIGRAISAQEAALGVLRQVLRTVTAEERQIENALAAEEEQLGRALSALLGMARAPQSAILVYPGDPVSAARAAAMLGDITPVLEERMSRLSERLARLDELRAVERQAEAEARAALAGLQDLRARSEQALAGRRHPPAPQSRRLEAQAEAATKSAGTLAELADELARLGRPGPRLGFEAARGRLPLPVSGAVVRRFGEPDHLGHPGAGWTLEAPAFAQVTAPWDGTVRYAGPLGRYGRVVVLEPETGYLMVLAGLGSVDREVGEVVLAGEKLGDLGGALPTTDEFLFEATMDDDLIGRENLYLELRRKGEPLDPALWFDEQAMQG